jgi:rhamnose utilization protein RhaD (predicted bifunctional aldolase and dehydrogenase)
MLKSVDNPLLENRWDDEVAQGHERIGIAALPLEHPRRRQAVTNYGGGNTSAKVMRPIR